jgi:hypothetical protein
MKILFLARHFSYLRNFESAIALMAERGHLVHLAVDREELLGGRQLVEQLAGRYPNITIGYTSGIRGSAWSELARSLRLGIDYLRYLDPRYAAAPKLVARSRDRTPTSVVLLAHLPLFRSRAGQRRLLGLLATLEHAIPTSAKLETYFREQAPDIVLITPLIDLGSPQLDYLTAAKSLGLRTVLCVTSWDHLSSKSLLRTFPDLITVWNEVQKTEATQLHEVPAERVTVTGAQCYDQWFGRQPSRSRASFCETVGLNPNLPFILYVCSIFVEEWIQQMRASSNPALREAGILVRPHPARLDEWQGIGLSDYRNVAFWGDHPITEGAKNDYFDSMYYAAAVVGLNTSAFLEAGIVGRPVHTILVPEISRENQEGTIHFHYLLTVNGGLLHAARNFGQHLQQLAESMSRPPETIDEMSRRFTEAFIRPHGIDVPATPRFVDAIEAMGSRQPTGLQGSRLVSLMLRPVLYPAVAALSLKMSTQWLRKKARSNVFRAARNARKTVLVKIKQAVIAQLKPVPVPRPEEIRPSALTPKLGRHRDPAKQLVGSQFREAKETKEQVAMLGSSSMPIVVGPWLTETGFELLYWIPFLTWAKSYGSLKEQNLIVISRGGVAPWYRHLTSNYHDVLNYYSPDEFRTRNEQRVVKARGKMKHLEISEFDQEIVDRVTKSIGVDKYRLLHPSMMYNLFQIFWRQQAPVTLIESFSAFRSMPRFELGDLRRHLPERYVTAKFYANTGLPDTPENRAFIAQFLEEMSHTTDIVLLNTADRYDDHGDFPPAVQSRLHTVEHLLTPANNLEIQSRIIANAKGFVGTYGGFSYLAPLCGVDTLAFYSHPTGFRFDHLEVAKRVFSSLRCGSFVPLEVRDLDVVRMGFGGTGQMPPAAVGIGR